MSATAGYRENLATGRSVWWWMALVAIIYALAGRFALLLAIPPGYASPIWPAAGFALAAVLFFGPRIWPGIVLGSFLVNVWTAIEGGELSTVFRSSALSLGIGLGAAAQALLGAALIRRAVGFPAALLGQREVWRFVILGGPVACTVNATVGPVCLSIAGINPWETIAIQWWYWWVGDTIGVLIVTPLVLTVFGSPREAWRPRLRTMALPLVLSLVVVTGMFVAARNWERDRIARDFERRASALSRTLAERFDNYQQVLKFIDAFFRGSQHVDRREFLEFVEAPLRRYPGILALSWNPVIESADRESLEQDLRREGFASFQITELGPGGQLVPARVRSQYTPVVYVEPFETNRQALGFDVSSDPVRLEAIKIAESTGRPSATEKVLLVQDGGDQPGVLVYHPVFRPTTEGVGGVMLDGYAVGAFRIAQMVTESLAGADLTGMDLYLFDDLAPEGKAQLLAIVDGVAITAPDRIGRVPSRGPNGLQWTSKLTMADRTWQLWLVPNLNYLADRQGWQLWLVLAGGLAFSSLLGVMLLIITGRGMLDAGRSRELSEANANLEQALRSHERAEDRFRRVVEAAPNGMVMTNGEGQIVLVNTEAERMFGYPRTELIGQSVDLLVPDRFRAGHSGHRGRYMKKPETRAMGAGRDLYGLRKDGSEFPIEIGLNPIETEEGVFVLAAVVDITERKRVEETLHDANEELRRRTAEMEQFVYSVSHDLKSPIVTLVGLLSMMDQDLKAGRQSLVEESLLHMKKAGDRLSRTIGDLLELSRVGRVDSNPEVLDTSRILSELLESLASQLKDAGMSVVIQSDLPSVIMDERRFIQVFENLLTNAMKYGVGGRNTIEIGCRRENEEDVFFVRDDGPGISEDYHDRIFGLFRRLHNDDRGTGVGLAIVKRIVELQGGKIWVESAEGRGATFCLTLPSRGMGLSTASPTGEA